MSTPVFFSDSFDHTDPATAPLKYGTGAGALGTYSLVAGPFHGNAARFTGAGNALSGMGEQPFGWVQFATPGFTCHLRLTGTDEVRLVEALYDDPDVEPRPVAPLVRQVLIVQDDGAISVNLTDGTLVGLSPPGVVPRTTGTPDTWVHLEYRTRLHLTAGLVAVRVDGAEVLRVTGVPTVYPLAPADWDDQAASFFRFGNVAEDGNTATVDVDDVLFYVWDGFESPEVWHGPKRVAARLPDGPGASTQFTVSGAPANWQACDEVPPDLDGSTVTSPVGTPSFPRDLYHRAAFPAFREQAPYPQPAGEPAPAQLSCWFLARGGPGLANTRGAGFFRFVPPAGDGSEDATDPVLTTAHRYHKAPTWEVLEGQDAAFVESLQLGFRVQASAPVGALVGTQCVAELAYLPAAALGGGARTWAVWLPDRE